MIHCPLARMLRAIALLAAAAPLTAQDVPATTRTIVVQLTGGNACATVKTVSFVFNGDDRNARAMEPDGTCRWRGRAPQAFPIDSARISLRLGGARTECGRPDPRQTSVAAFTFVYAPASARNITLTTRDTRGQWVDVDYVRYVNGDDCRENGTLDARRHDIADVDDNLEEIHLRFPNADAATGLLINHDAVLKKKTLEGKDLVMMLRDQAVGGKRHFPPNGGIPMLKNDEDALNASPIKRIEVAVVP